MTFIPAALLFSRSGMDVQVKKETKSIANYSALILPWNITKYLLKKKYFKKIKYTSIAKITRNIK